jgi:hypothetical protein
VKYLSSKFAFRKSFFNKFELLAHGTDIKKLTLRVQALKKKKAAAGKKAAPSDAVKAAAAEA